MAMFQGKHDGFTYDCSYRWDGTHVLGRRWCVGLASRSVRFMGA